MKFDTSDYLNACIITDCDWEAQYKRLRDDGYKAWQIQEANTKTSARGYEMAIKAAVLEAELFVNKKGRYARSND